MTRYLGRSRSFLWLSRFFCWVLFHLVSINRQRPPECEPVLLLKELVAQCESVAASAISKGSPGVSDAPRCSQMLPAFAPQGELTFGSSQMTSGDSFVSLWTTAPQHMGRLDDWTTQRVKEFERYQSIQLDQLDRLDPLAMVDTL